MAVLKSWYQSKRSDLLWLTPWLCPSTGNNPSVTEWLSSMCRQSWAQQCWCHFPGGSPLSSQLHTPVKLLLWAVSSVLNPLGEHTPSLLSSGSLPCTSLPKPLLGGCDQRGIRINQDSDCKKKKKAQTNGDKISFYLEAKGQVLWMNVLRCKNYDAFR